ncbi:hypothetical protein J582_3780 [Acinetobacter sp. 1566109]|nr:hypothetical protein J582_3780 [Acinetobacter sp. 1566109]
MHKSSYSKPINILEMPYGSPLPIIHLFFKTINPKKIFVKVIEK